MRPDNDIFDPTPSSTPATERCVAYLEAGIRAAAPDRAIQQTLSLEGRTVTVDRDQYEINQDLLVIGGGNAAGHVARGLEAVLGSTIDEGMVVTDVPVETDVVSVQPGDHPIPSRRGAQSTERMLELARQADEGDLVLTVVTGGGSALMPAPADTVSLEDLQEITEALLHSGATIDEINAVRKHLSAVKGGRLAEAAAPATVVNLVFSDVVGDDPSVVASGPTAPDPTTYEDALDVLDRYDITPPHGVDQRLTAGVRGAQPETPTADAACFSTTSSHVLVDGYTAIEAAAEQAQDDGYNSIVLSSRIRGEARDAARSQVAIAEEVEATGNPVEPPAVLASGGETTVTVTGDGIGGPNQEFALAAAIELESVDVAVASVDTDGIDGATDAAGAVVHTDTVTNVSDAKQALQRNDAYPILQENGAVLISGPTGTNVNDLRIIVIE